MRFPPRLLYRSWLKMHMGNHLDAVCYRPIKRIVLLSAVFVLFSDVGGCLLRVTHTNWLRNHVTYCSHENFLLSKMGETALKPCPSSSGKISDCVALNMRLSLPGGSHSIISLPFLPCLLILLLLAVSRSDCRSLYDGC